MIKPPNTICLVLCDACDGYAITGGIPSGILAPQCPKCRKYMRSYVEYQAVKMGTKEENKKDDTKNEKDRGFSFKSSIDL